MSAQDQRQNQEIGLKFLFPAEGWYMLEWHPALRFLRATPTKEEHLAMTYCDRPDRATHASDFTLRVRKVAIGAFKR